MSDINQNVSIHISYQSNWPIHSPISQQVYLACSFSVSCSMPVTWYIRDITHMDMNRFDLLCWLHFSLSHLQFWITNWGFKWECISKLQKRALRIMTNSRYNGYTEPLFKKLNLLKVKHMFDFQCLKFWYKFMNNKLPNYFREFNHELHDIETRIDDYLHLYPTSTSGARNVLRHHIPELLNKFPKYLIDILKRHSMYSFSQQIKCYLVDLFNYECNNINCYVCSYTREWQIAP